MYLTLHNAGTWHRPGSARLVTASRSTHLDSFLVYPTHGTIRVPSRAPRGGEGAVVPPVARWGLLPRPTQIVRRPRACTAHKQPQRHNVSRKKKKKNTSCASRVFCDRERSSTSLGRGVSFILWPLSPSLAFLQTLTVWRLPVVISASFGPSLDLDLLPCL